MRELHNPFTKIYKDVNKGSSYEKFCRLKESGGDMLPAYLDVELTNMCNFSCVFCPTGTKAMQRVRGMMSEEVADALAENVKKYNIPGVRFIRWGEPTMHPDYISIMEKIKKAGAIIHINTNGSLLDEGQIERLLGIHLDSIKFSFQGADVGTYNEMRKGGDYKRIVENLRLFYNMRGEREYPFIQVSTTLTTETMEQIESFKSDIANCCDYYNVGYTKLNHISVEQMSINGEEKEKIRAIQLKESRNIKRIKVCPEAFDKLSINWNGDVTLCCADYDNFMIVGNILVNDIKAIFNGRVADLYREIIAKGEYERIKCCSTCYETIPLTV